MRVTPASPSIGARVFAWCGALVFVTSLSYFLYAYGVTFGEIPPAESERSTLAAILIDVALFTVFALHHSVCARLPVRAWVARLVPPYLERSFYVWTASLMLIAVCAWWRPVPGVVWEVTGLAKWALIVAQAAGVWLAVGSAAAIDVLELSGIRQLAPQATTRMEFKTSGPYGWVRHPIYSGWFLIVFAAPAMTATRFVFAVVSSLYLVIAIPFEERSLRATSEGAYDTYAGLVRWKLIPRVY